MRHDEEYYSHRLICPHCSSDIVEYEDYDWDDDVKWEKYICQDCGAVMEFGFCLHDTPHRVLWEDPEPETPPSRTPEPAPITYPDTPLGRLQEQDLNIHANLIRAQNSLAFHLALVDNEYPRNSAKLPQELIRQWRDNRRQEITASFKAEIERLEAEQKKVQDEMVAMQLNAIQELERELQSTPDESEPSICESEPILCERHTFVPHASNVSAIYRNLLYRETHA
jgi:hypothetical protein